MIGIFNTRLTNRIGSGNGTMRIPSIGLKSLIVVLTLGLSASALAQDDASMSLEEVLRAMQNEREAVAEANRERERRFRAQETDREAELRRVRNEVNQAEAEAGRLENLRNELDRELAELREQLAERQGEFGELFGVARAAAADLESSSTTR